MDGQDSIVTLQCALLHAYMGLALVPIIASARLVGLGPSVQSEYVQNVSMVYAEPQRVVGASMGTMDLIAISPQVIRLVNMGIRLLRILVNVK